MARAPKANTTESTVWTGAYLDAMVSHKTMNLKKDMAHVWWASNQG